jgi:hypothetical protein
LQHPADGGTHQRAGNQNTKPRVSQEDLACSEEQSLPWEVHRHIGGLHGDVDGLEMGPHLRRWVGQATKRESVRRKQKAEIIRDKGQWNGEKRKKSKAQEGHSEANGGNRDAPSSCQPAEGVLDA